ncbi:threonylcarbamoyl-AMP synthase [Winogradskyella sp. DF17]|uniref:Threonylcarbamoyl-AMP synthase n=1 Tax=Winogradskyella pelagia TaxID=2819984 RepID=A0ABS3SYG1_9FLAO|nr:L-threonylcarbamoyladenylate synthase [Winogradskyella sp. DF17]MBO3115515.1 threonylcarbamoyl-AMP synthase [Winogradskyella sp. DF17]
MSIISTDINKAIAILKAEQLVAIPTETVYGLAGNIFSEKAIKAIFKTKQRPHFNPLIVHIGNKKNLDTIASYVPKKAQLLADTFWPGAITLVLPKRNHIPDIITAGKSTVAVRVPNHPLTLELLSKLDFPLAAPSANPFNRISPTTVGHVESYFGSTIDLILDGGPCKKGIESTIIGFEGEEPVIYRLGSISIEDIEAVVGRIGIKNTKTNKPLAPGMLERHYAPKTKTVLTDSLKDAIKQYSGLKIGILAFNDFMEDENISAKRVLSNTGNNLNEAAAKLYDALHMLDKQNLDIIIAERLPDFGLGKSINDRLKRAAK